MKFEHYSRSQSSGKSTLRGIAKSVELHWDDLRILFKMASWNVLVRKKMQLRATFCSHNCWRSILTLMFDVLDTSARLVMFAIGGNSAAFHSIPNVFVYRSAGNCWVGLASLRLSSRTVDSLEFHFLNIIAKISPSWINAYPLFCFEVLARVKIL